MSTGGEIPKIERLLRLMALLLDTPRALTAEEIRERLGAYAAADEAFRRTFERDKDEIREMGVAITVEQVGATDPPSTGYRIRPEDYYLRDPGLAPDELAALRLAMTAVRIETEADLIDPLRKLGGVPDTGLTDTASGTTARLPTTPHLVDLFGAVLERQRVAFDYGGTRRHVHPLRLDYLRGRWYLTCWDEDREDDRHFRLDRITGEVAMVGEPGAFPPAHRSPTRLEPWAMGGEPAQRAVVRFDPGYVAQATAQLGPDAAVHPRDDGSALVEFDVTNPDAFRSFVLGFLDHAEVIAPATLRDDMVSWLEALA